MQYSKPEELQHSKTVSPSERDPKRSSIFRCPHEQVFVPGVEFWGGESKNPRLQLSIPFKYLRTL